MKYRICLEWDFVSTTEFKGYTVWIDPKTGIGSIHIKSGTA